MITRPAVNAQINSGPRGSSNNTKNVVNSSKSGPVGKSLTTKTSLRQAKRTVPTSVKCSLSNVQLQLNTEANGDLEVILNPPLPSTRLAPKVQDDVSSKTAIPLPQTACHTSVSMQRTQLQMAKPSGLRMPSPSLGFFGQSKAPPLQNPSRRNSQPSNLSMSDTSNLRNLGSPITVFESRAPLAPRSLPEVIKDGARTGNIKASCATSGCSVPSAINPALHEIVESDSRVSNMQKMEQKVQCNDNVSKAIKGQKEFDSTFVSIDHQILGQTGQCTSKSTSQIEDLMQQRNDDDFLQTGTLQQVDKYDTNMKVVDDSAMSTKGSEIEENPDLTSHSSSASEVTAFSVKSNINDHLFAEDKPSYLSIEDHGVSSKINVGKCNVSESCGEQAEMMDALSCEAGPISSSEMLQNNVANISSEVQNNSVTEIEKSDAPSPLRSIEQKNDGTNSLQKVGAQLNLEDAGVQSPDANTTVESSKSYISTLITNQHEVVVSDAVEKPEYLEFSKCLLTTEHALRDQVMLQVDDCLLGGKSFFPEESKLENNIQSDEPKGTDACESEFKRSSSPCLILVSMQDCGSDTAKLVERKNLEDILLVSVDSEPVVENYNQDAQFQNDVQLHGHSTSVELENMDEDHLTDAVSAEDVNVTCQRSGHFGGSGNFGESEREVPYITCEPSLKVQVEGDSWINHTPKHDDAEDKKINLSVESSCRNTNLKPEDKLSLDYDHSSMGKIYLLRGENDVSKHQEEQDEQVMPCFSEADRIPHEEKQSLEAHCLFHYLEKPQKSQDGNNTDVYLEVSVHDGSGLESLGQALKESEAANCMMGEPDGNSDLQDPVNQIPITDVDLEVGVHDGSGLESLGQALKESKAANCMKGEPDGNSDLQDPVNQINKVLLASVPGVSLDHVSLVDNSAEVLCEEIDFENVLKERDEGPIVHIDGLDVNKNAESLEVEVAATSSLEIALSVENMRCVTKCRHENELSKEANSPKSYLDPNVSNNQESVNCTHDIEQQHELENTLPTEDQDVTKKRENTGIEKKQDILVKPPPYATPFSDEWFAAFEAAGEEILTMKTGAVQNSPQDRSPEPGPWSPVKRKLNQEIGPFDCTKYTNTNQ
ncbi:uncharacterized protein LOC21394483 [Morus notabilis]|nr:uncharacterized protein LOC21394483 [Morus notabilis]